MERLIALIEKGKPFFNAIARNKYLKGDFADGFISVMPIIIVSSVFLLVSAVPNVWGFYWPAEIKRRAHEGLQLLDGHRRHLRSGHHGPSTSAMRKTATCPRTTRSTSSRS